MTVPLDTGGEMIYIVAPDGETLEFALNSSLGSFAGLGTPPFDFLTSKAFRQDGSSLLDNFAEERVLTIDYQEGPFGTRQEWWDRRRELQDFFRPTRGGVFTLYVQQPERSFYIRVMPDPGLEFLGTDVNSQTIQETIRLRAFDPFWIDGDVDATTFESVTAEQLIFPITFPITFGASGTRFGTGDLEYPGTAKSYPIITVTGPYTTVSLTILPQNKLIRLSVPILEGETRVIDPNPVNPSIVDLDGVSHFDELDLASSPLQDFAILPEPPGDGQSILVVFTGATVSLTTAQIQFETKYIGI